MKWLKNLHGVLNKEPENWLAYLHGQQLGNILHITRKAPRFRGVFLTFLKFCYFLVKDFSLFPRKGHKGQCAYYLFAGTKNQISSLDGLADALKKRGAKIHGVASQKQIDDEFKKAVYQPLKFGLTDIAKVFLLLASRFIYLKRLVSQEYSDVTDWSLGSFLRAYPYLVFFQKDLEKINPEYVVVSNDHNVPNRCLLALAHSLGIKTVYLQHASVSNLFPALRVNYAFLDGESALNTYRECEGNQLSQATNYPMPKVLLTGQKKVLSRDELVVNNAVGLALNALDDTSAAVKLVDFLVESGFTVNVRWHPGQGRRDVATIKEAFSGQGNVKLSDPAQEPVSTFLSSLGWLIAGNSSIHLEAALSGVLPVYFELMPADNPDYYGYVKHGIAACAESFDELAALLKDTQCAPKPKPEAVRYYSATYLTEWEGKEGELVAECLANIRNGDQPPVEMLDLLPNRQMEHGKKGSIAISVEGAVPEPEHASMGGGVDA